jgi:hypothetical protein
MVLAGAKEQIIKELTQLSDALRSWNQNKPRTSWGGGDT